MAIHSMTGHGRGAAAARGITMAVELTAVNHKQFDCRLQVPPVLEAMVGRLREQIHECVARGSVMCRVTLDLSPRLRRQEVGLDPVLAAAWVRCLRQSARRLKVKDDLAISHLVTLPGVVRARNLDNHLPPVVALVTQSLARALQALIRMRACEGQVLARDLRTRLGRLRACVRRIARRAPAVTARYRRQLHRRLQEAGIVCPDQDGRLAKEIALFADRADIAEEITRLHSHLEQALAGLHADTPVGRTLDFLLQEMFREINTIGSKANDRLIAGQVIHGKAELERIREQAQNIE